MSKHYFHNGLPMKTAFKAAVDTYISRAHAEGCKASAAEIRAMFECMVMDAADIEVDDSVRTTAALCRLDDLAIA